MKKQDLMQIVEHISRQKPVFKEKAVFDSQIYPEHISGRTTQTTQLANYLLGYKQGYVVPLISIHGRSGSGKSTLVKFVCENLEDVDSCFVNLRMAKTVFGCINLVLSELGASNVKSYHGDNVAFVKIEKSICNIMKKSKKKLFVLVLDEFDAIFYDKRGRPSDFLFRFVSLEEKLRKKGYLMNIITISNNIAIDYDIDDRLRSRIGNSEVYFEPYTKQEIFDILYEKAKVSLSYTIDGKILDRCAQLSSAEHGDARRAVDLLRRTAELAQEFGENISEKHVEKAEAELEKEKATFFVKNASYHLKMVCLAIVRLSFLTGDSWISTSIIYQLYCNLVKSQTELCYRQICNLLSEIQQAGLVTSQTRSRGRQGYGKQYQLTIPPEQFDMVFPISLGMCRKVKEYFDDYLHSPKHLSQTWRNKLDGFTVQKEWHDFVFYGKSPYK